MNNPTLEKTFIELIRQNERLIYKVCSIYVFGVFSYYELKANLNLWIFLVVTFILGIIGTYWQYKKFYDANIQSIRKSLEELKELEEE